MKTVRGVLILDYFIYLLFSLEGHRPQPESHFRYLRSNVY